MAAYEAKMKDDSVQELLIEAFRLAELRFNNFDQDDAGVIFFPELKIALENSSHEQELCLQKIWEECDVDKSNTMDFGEFLYFLHLWQYSALIRDSEDQFDLRVMSASYAELERAINAYGCFYSIPGNAKVSAMAFKSLEDLFRAFDVNKDRKLSRKELESFLKQQLPCIARAATLQNNLNLFYGSSRQELVFNEFLLFIYLMLLDVAGTSRLKGKYRYQCVPDRKPFTAEDLKLTLVLLAQDFCSFDKDGNGMLSLEEIVSSRKQSGKKLKISFFSRLQFHISYIDQAKIGEIDYFGFCFLALQMCRDGSYQDLIMSSQNASTIKRNFVQMLELFIKHNPAKKFRFHYVEVEEMLKQLSGSIPPPSKQIFDSLKYSSSTAGEDVVDVPRMLRLFYYLLLPSGPFSPSQYKPRLPKKRMDGDFVVHLHEGQTVIDNVSRIDPVDVNKVSKLQKLGEGGQGIAYLATYNGIPLCAKFVRAQLTPMLLQEVKKEVSCMEKLRHPNCHALIGSCLNASNVVILTALCENGSIFDFYTKQLLPSHKRFDPVTSQRLALESARGLHYMHSLHPSMMHRDLKSLNVFLDKNMIAKIADFGMATEETTSSVGLGTIQWMAPEVLWNLKGRKCPYDKRCDIYSFGVLMWEIFHCQIPYANTGKDNAALIHSILFEGLKLLPSGHCCPTDIAHLISSCMSVDAKLRPSFDDIVQQLAKAGEVTDSLVSLAIQ